MIKLKYLAVLIFACPLFMKAQDLTGTWVGGIDRLYVKLVVIHKGDSLRGYTYDKQDSYCQATFLGNYKSTKKLLTGANVEMINNSGGHILSDYELTYSKKKGRERLIGTMGSKNNPLTFFMALPKLYLYKQTNEIDTIAFMKPFINKAN